MLSEFVFQVSYAIYTKTTQLELSCLENGFIVKEVIIMNRLVCYCTFTWKNKYLKKDRFNLEKQQVQPPSASWRRLYLDDAKVALNCPGASLDCLVSSRWLIFVVDLHFVLLAAASSFPLVVPFPASSLAVASTPVDLIGASSQSALRPSSTWSSAESGSASSLGKPCSTWALTWHQMTKMAPPLRTWAVSSCPSCSYSAPSTSPSSPLALFRLLFWLEMVVWKWEHNFIMIFDL